MYTPVNVVVFSVVIAAGVSLGCEATSVLQPSPTGLALSAVVPISGPTDGATELRITGSGFQAGVTVTVGDLPAHVIAVSNTTLAARAPSHDAGTVDLVVTNPDGRSARLPGAYTYVLFEAIAVQPGSGLAGTTVAIVGSGFRPGVTAAFDDLATTVSVVTSTRMTATVPAHAAGAVDVAVVDPSGVRRTLPGGFMYETVILIAEPAVAAAGDLLSVSWSAPNGRSALDWIGLFKIGEPSTNYLSRWWDYTSGASSGTLRLNAPSPGVYEFRYLPDDGFIAAGRSAPVTIR
jgi:hypothetical protein